MADKQTKPKYNIVMLVDDNEIDNFINERMIMGCQFAETVYINTSTRSAIEFLRNLSTNEHLREGHLPAIIFLDINMPILDGFRFIEEFEKMDPRLVEAIRIVMLTSSINPSDIERSRQHASVKGFIHKPLTEEALKSL